MTFNWKQFSDNCVNGILPPDQVSREILESAESDLLAILDAAYRIRMRYFGQEVYIHILNNIQNGHCPEDCHYCAQTQDASTGIRQYPLKSNAEILAEAKAAELRGAYRYCLVFAGRSPSLSRIQQLAQTVKEIKRQSNLQICVSPGILDDEQAHILKEAGVDRINHNLNTSERFYPKICTTHRYTDRVETLKIVKKAGMSVCSGLIIGMGEKSDDIISVAKTLREIEAESIPINFFLPIPGTRLKIPEHLTPQYCLRVLCLFRFLNPRADIRVAAGREFYLRSLEVFALYPATSLFLSGYLNVRGDEDSKTLMMIKEAGFNVHAEEDLSSLINKSVAASQNAAARQPDIDLKSWDELHPSV